MQSSTDVLDAMAAKDRANGGTGTDYAIAKILGVTPQRVSDIRRGRHSLSRTLAVPAADFLGVDPAAIVTIAIAERETDARLRAALLKLARTALPATAAALAAIVVGMLAHPIARAADCILCKIRRGGKIAPYSQAQFSGNPMLACAC